MKYTFTLIIVTITFMTSQLAFAEESHRTIDDTLNNGIQLIEKISKRASAPNDELTVYVDIINLEDCNKLVKSHRVTLKALQQTMEHVFGVKSKTTELHSDKVYFDMFICEAQLSNLNVQIEQLKRTIFMKLATEYGSPKPRSSESGVKVMYPKNIFLDAPTR